MMEKAKNYLASRIEKGDKVLLGLSGGPDSMALFTLLQEGGYLFEVAHIDHHWREESGREAKELEQKVRQASIPFHLLSLTAPPPEQNVEDFFRQKRLAYFEELYLKGGFKALLLGHQREDQMETILKRIFEGGYLTTLSGIKQEGVLGSMRVLRPLLETSKEEILEWLKEKGISYFEDRTNFDSLYLRARMRKEILPFLEESFGKKIGENLLILGKRIERWAQFLEKRVEELFLHIVKTSEEESIEAKWVEEEALFEMFIRKWMQEKGVALSREEIDLLYKVVKKGEGGKGIKKKGYSLQFKGKKLTLVKECLG